MSVKQRSFNMGLGTILQSPDLLDLMQTNMCDRFDDAEEMQRYNCIEPFPDDVILLEQNELQDLPPKRHSDCLDIIGVPLQERLTICVVEEDVNKNDILIPIEGIVIDSWLSKTYKRIKLSHPVYSGPYPDLGIVEHIDAIEL